MNRIQVPIFELKNIAVSYSDKTVLKISNFKFHRGTVYSITGPIGCGKSTFLKLLSGWLVPLEGEVLYERGVYKKTWRGVVKRPKEIIVCEEIIVASNGTVMQFFRERFGDRTEKLKKQYYANSSGSKEWDSPTKELSQGQIERLKLVTSIESDPKVLIIDDYGIHFDSDTLMDFNKKLHHVARAKGITVILASRRPKDLSGGVSVQLSLDNGHLAKVRSFKRKDQRRSKS